MKRRDVVVWLAVLALVVSLAAMMRTVRADGEGDPANTGETWTLNVSNADRIDEELAKASSGAKIVIRAECYEVMDVPGRNVGGLCFNGTLIPETAGFVVALEQDPVVGDIVSTEFYVDAILKYAKKTLNPGKSI